MRTSVLIRCLMGFLTAAAVLGTTAETVAAQTARRIHAAAAQARFETDDVSVGALGQPPEADLVCNSRQCFPAGRFTVKVVGVDHLLFGYYHTLRLSLQFRNVSDHPLVLAYRAGTGKAVDDLGNAYLTGETGVRGMATDYGLRTGPRFLLQPDERRTATFEAVGPRSGKQPSWFNYDLTIAELAPGWPSRALREYAIFFPDVEASRGARRQGRRKK